MQVRLYVYLIYWHVVCVLWAKVPLYFNCTVIYLHQKKT